MAEQLGPPPGDAVGRAALGGCGTAALPMALLSLLGMAISVVAVALDGFEEAGGLIIPAIWTAGWCVFVLWTLRKARSRSHP